MTNLALAHDLPTTPSQLDPTHGAPRRSPIEIVTTRVQRQSRPRIVYALVATAALFVLLLTQLGISIALSHGAYQISSLQSQQVTLDRSQQKYAEKLTVLSSPQNIANNASALGMVRNQNPVYLDLASGTVYGTPTAAAAAGATSANLIGNSLLAGVPVVTETAKQKAAAAKQKAAAAKQKAAAAKQKAAAVGQEAAAAGAKQQTAVAGQAAAATDEGQQTKNAATSSTASGAAASESGSSKVASDANQLAAPETR